MRRLLYVLDVLSYSLLFLILGGALVLLGALI